MVGKILIPFSFLFISLSSCGQSATPVDVQQQSVMYLPVDTTPKKPRNLKRFEKEILRFEEADKSAMPALGSVLFVGSSTIRLWKSVSEDMAPISVINRGFGGATIAEVNYYFQRIVAKYQPSFLVFYAGENDLFSSDISVDSVVNDFNRFRINMHQYVPKCRMFFISVKPSPARWSFQEKFLDANKRFKAICEADPRWTYINMVPPMLDVSGRPKKEIYRADSLHMNAGGYTEWAKVIKPTLKAALKKAEEPVQKAN